MLLRVHRGALFSLPTSPTCLPSPGAHSALPRGTWGTALELPFLGSAFICSFPSCQPALPEEPVRRGAVSDVSCSGSGAEILGLDGQCTLKIPLLWAARTVWDPKALISSDVRGLLPFRRGAVPSCCGGKNEVPVVGGAVVLTLGPPWEEEALWGP